MKLNLDFGVSGRRDKRGTANAERERQNNKEQK
jgi:hypothetical protein